MLNRLKRILAEGRPETDQIAIKGGEFSLTSLSRSLTECMAVRKIATLTVNAEE